MTNPRFTLPPVPQFGASLALLIAAYSTPVLATLGPSFAPAKASAALTARSHSPAAAAASGVAEAADAAPRYTCPMHPDVDSDKPGRCPHCGMKLEEKKAPEPRAAS